MVRELIHDPLFLAGRSSPASAEDVAVGQDLLDTLRAHSHECVGMAANMIGVRKCVIAFFDESGPFPTYTVMYDPGLIAREGQYETEEGCLSLLGAPRKCTRYRKIRVRFRAADGKTVERTYTGFTAQIIQHEVDHLSGILI